MEVASFSKMNLDFIARAQNPEDERPSLGAPPRHSLHLQDARGIRHNPRPRTAPPITWPHVAVSDPLLLHALKEEAFLFVCEQPRVFHLLRMPVCTWWLLQAHPHHPFLRDVVCVDQLRRYWFVLVHACQVLRRLPPPHGLVIQRELQAMWCPCEDLAELRNCCGREHVNLHFPVLEPTSSRANCDPHWNSGDGRHRPSGILHLW
mmetsp:Transcript_35423/g.82270  ORF Transcript_35423/g.82270 Transcript_35423/m.82270 type:complete len:205 (-) Transcript_35423:412-1026(-)